MTSGYETAGTLNPGQTRILTPLAVAAALILTLVVYYGQMLPMGSLQHPDEYLALDRTHSFTLRDDWLTVYSENLPTFKKPPLQYWIGAWLLERGLDLELSLRLASFVFAIATLVLVGTFAWMILPESPWVFPTAVLLLASSKRFWEAAMSAMLDSGATFFAMLALVATFAAVRQPRWWYLVAIACGAGALQKAPIAVGFSGIAIAGIALTRKYQGLPLPRCLLSKHFILALGIALVLVLVWPALQWFRYGQESFHQAYMSQIVERFSPFGEDWEKRPALYSLLIAGEPILRLSAVAAALWLPWRLRRMELVSLPTMIALFAIMVAGSTGIVSPRYSLLFLPLLISCLAAIILAVARGWRWQTAIVGLLCVASLGPFKTAGQLEILENEQTKFVPLLRHIGAALRPEETLLVCGRGGGTRVYIGAVSYYASDGRPFHRIRSPEQLLALQAEGAIRPPYRFVCVADRFEALRPFLQEVAVVEEVGSLVHLTATGVSDQQ